MIQEHEEFGLTTSSHGKISQNVMTQRSQKVQGVQISNHLLSLTCHFLISQLKYNNTTKTTKKRLKKRLHSLVNIKRLHSLCYKHK